MKSTRLGQHFLVNRAIAEKIVKAFLPVSGPILEIGPGKGILSQFLVKYCPDNKITAVELDPLLVDGLKTRFHEEVEVINRDILQIDLDQLFPGDQDRVNIIGNVPYYISKELVDWVLAWRGKIARGLFMMQKEFVDKLVIKGGVRQSGARSILFNGLFSWKKVCDVQPGSFSPPPKVKSTVFWFEPGINSLEGEVEVDKFYLFLQGCFRNRRKTLFNNLVALYAPGVLKEIFVGMQMDFKVRAEQLELEDFLQIYRGASNLRQHR